MTFELWTLLPFDVLLPGEWRGTRVCVLAHLGVLFGGLGPLSLNVLHRFVSLDSLKNSAGQRYVPLRGTGTEQNIWESTLKTILADRFARIPGIDSLRSTFASCFIQINKKPLVLKSQVFAANMTTLKENLTDRFVRIQVDSLRSIFIIICDELSHTDEIPLSLNRKFHGKYEWENPLLKRI